MKLATALANGSKPVVACVIDEKGLTVLGKAYCDGQEAWWYKNGKKEPTKMTIREAKKLDWAIESL